MEPDTILGVTILVLTQRHDVEPRQYTQGHKRTLVCPLNSFYMRYQWNWKQQCVGVLLFVLPPSCLLRVISISTLFPLEKFTSSYTFSDTHSHTHTHTYTHTHTHTPQTYGEKRSMVYLLRCWAWLAIFKEDSLSTAQLHLCPLLCILHPPPSTFTLNKGRVKLVQLLILLHWPDECSFMSLNLGKLTNILMNADAFNLTSISLIYWHLHQ